ncbi:MAG: alpha/beta hydrolase [Crocinitomicaceae bacterium]|nr:alpha/beta hydrolase [Crocinitomicaceae bacterium]
MIKQTNLIYTGSSERQSLYDLFLPEEDKQQPVLVFMHGYMGYKDWGCWNLMGEEIAKQGYPFAKFTITHSGTTLDQPVVFADLEAFGNGGYLKELRDLQYFLNHLEKEHGFREFILIGHSRGGGDVLLVANDVRVKQVHCLAPICDIASRFPKKERLEQWKEKGVYYHKNGRTNQEMPHFYSQYEDFLTHQEKLSIEKACKQLNKPVFVYHGSDDASVPPHEGQTVAKWTKGQFYLIENTAHTFDSKEPWEENEMPDKFKLVVDLIVKNIGL